MADFRLPELLDKWQKSVCSINNWKYSSFLFGFQCSKDCGFGEKTRDVYCTDTDNNRVNSSLCDRSKMPKNRRRCSEFPCPFMWNTSPWSEVIDRVTTTYVYIQKNSIQYNLRFYKLYRNAGKTAFSKIKIDVFSFLVDSLLWPLLHKFYCVLFRLSINTCTNKQVFVKLSLNSTGKFRPGITFLYQWCLLFIYTCNNNG